jgi:hypothetical protein
MATHVLCYFSMKRTGALFFLLDELVAKSYLNNAQTYLFTMTTLIFNDGLQSTRESFTGDTQRFLRDQVPFSCQFELQTIQRIMRCSADLIF